MLYVIHDGIIRTSYCAVEQLYNLICECSEKLFNSSNNMCNIN